MHQLTPIALAVAQAKCLAAHSPKVDRDMADLAPLIRETAQRIHSRHYALQRQLAADFIAHAPALIWSRIEHFQTWYFQELPVEVRSAKEKDFFAAWCYRELHFRYLDLGRQQRSAPRHAPLDATGEFADTREAGVTSPYDFALSPLEAQQLSDWDPLDGVILFCLAGHWEQVPPRLWSRWLDELSLAAPFPPQSFVDAPRPQRRACLAQALHVSRDVIFQRWHRLKKKYLA